MRFAQGIASALALLLCIAAGLLADAHPWAGFMCVLFAVMLVWFASLEPPRPPPHQRPYKWPDNGAP